jgi:hypothetical protein
MLLQMTSAGAMGGGVSSAIARARGSGNEAAARRLVVHAFVIALAAGLLFTLVFLLAGRPLYALLGGGDDTLAQAIAYSDILFGGAALVWLANTFAASLRGGGSTAVPAAALAVAALVQVPLSGALTLGWGPFPALGIRGAALAYATSFGLATAIMGACVWAGALRPREGDWRLEWRLFREILRVGALSSISALQTVAAAIILTGCVGTFGTAPSPATASACGSSCFWCRSCSPSARRWSSWSARISAPGRRRARGASPGPAPSRRWRSASRSAAPRRSRPRSGSACSAATPACTTPAASTCASSRRSTRSSAPAWRSTRRAGRRAGRSADPRRHGAPGGGRRRRTARGVERRAALLAVRGHRLRHGAVRRDRGGRSAPHALVVTAGARR